jgi:hypothetical protein
MEKGDCAKIEREVRRESSKPLKVFLINIFWWLV